MKTRNWFTQVRLPLEAFHDDRNNPCSQGKRDAANDNVWRQAV